MGNESKEIRNWPFCGYNYIKVKEENDKLQIYCNVCGNYYFTKEFLSNKISKIFLKDGNLLKEGELLKNDKFVKKHIVAGYLLEFNTNLNIKKGFLIVDEIIDDIRNKAPSNTLEKLDRLLLNLYKKYGDSGITFIPSNSNDNTYKQEYIFPCYGYAKDLAQLKHFLTLLEKESYLEKEGNGYSFTLKGYEKVEQLKQGGGSDNPSTQSQIQSQSQTVITNLNFITNT